MSTWTPLFAFFQGFLRVLCTVFFDLKAYGTHHIPRTGGVLLLSNHQSYLDPVLLAVKLPRQLSYLAKSELFENRYFGGLIRRLHAFPVQQGKGDRAAIKETLRRLKEGHLLTIYPEGSRTEDGEIGPIQNGAPFIIHAMDAAVTVVPAVIEGAYAAWPRRRKVPRTRPVWVLYGPPLVVAGKSRDELRDLIDTTLRAMLQDLRRRIAAERGRGSPGR